MKNPRKKALEDFAKDVERGIPLAEDYIGKSGDIYTDALRARNLAEEALAQKVLDNTGIPIPDKTSSLSSKEDFLNQLLQEKYPETKSSIRFKDLPGAYGEYDNGNIYLNKDIASKRDIQNLVADTLHEGAHSYDETKKLKSPYDFEDFNKELRALKASGMDLKNADPAEVYELMAKKHHANIPKLREGTFGLGALKSYLKSGTFKGVAPAMVKGAAAGAGGLASLAAEAADSEEEGSSLEQAALLREVDQARREKKILEAMPEQNRAKVKEEMEKDRLGLRRNALESILGK